MDKKNKILVTALLLITFIIPIITYYFILGNVPALNPKEALELLSSNQALLVDVREQSQFDSRHIDGSGNLPLSLINTLQSSSKFPPEFFRKKILLVCNSGFTSAMAAKKMIALNMNNVYNIRGGIQEWNSLSSRNDTSKYRNLLNNIGMPVDSFKPSSIYEQWIAFGSAFIIKPLYLILSLLLFLLCSRFTSLDARALRYSLLFFFIGELFCAVNYIFFGETSYIFEYLHIFGMILSFCFFFFAIIEAADKRMILFSNEEKKCSLLNLCRGCYKNSSIDCRLRKMFITFVISCIILCFIPLLAYVNAGSYTTKILGYQYFYSHPVVYQMLEFRLLPFFAIFFFIIALILLIAGKKKVSLNAKLAFAAGIGFLGFSLFRLILFKVYSDNLTWFVAAEEITELIFILNIDIALWMFRREIYPFGKKKLSA